MKPDSAQFSFDFSMAIRKTNGRPLTLVGTGLTTPDGATVPVAHGVAPQLARGPDDLHLFGARDGAHGSIEYLARLFAVEDATGTSFESGWAVIVPGQLGGGRLAEQCLFAAGVFGYRLALVIESADLGFLKSFCQDPVRIGFRKRGGMLHMAVQWDSGICCVARFDASGFIESQCPLPTGTKAHHQGIMLKLVDASTGYVAAARFVRMPSSFMRRLLARIRQDLSTASVRRPWSTDCSGVFLCHDHYAEVIGATRLVYGDDCPVTSLWIPTAAVGPLMRFGSLEVAA
jgi:hypothetical protein